MSWKEPDDLLRRALEPPPAAAARIAAAALAPRRRRRRGAGGLLAATALAAALAAAWSASRLDRPAPALGRPPEPGAVLITNRRGPLTVESPSGPVLVLLAGGAS